MTTHYKVIDNVAVLSMDNPPVNSLSASSSAALGEGIEKALNDNNIKGIVITGSNRAFCAGAEITQFDKKGGKKGGKKPKPLNVILHEMELSKKPVAAAVHGFALGGGCEVSLACHYRLAEPTANFGLPEVNLGLLPGAGGTQRLPRIVGALKALEFMVDGSPVNAVAAKKLGIVDEILDPKKDRVQQAVDFVLAKSKLPDNGVRPTCLRKIPGGLPIKDMDKLYNKWMRKRKGEIAPLNNRLAIEASHTYENNFLAGMKEEARLFNELVRSSESASLRHLFFAERATQKLPKEFKAKPKTVKLVGIIGAGTMGGGIAQCCADVGIRVIILDIKQQFLDKGLKVIKKNYDTSAARGRITTDKANKRFSLIKGTTNYSDLKDCDIVIEAVFESMKVKKEVFQQLDKVCKKDALLFTNTSGLNIDEIASATSRPENVLGAHFFSPANVMRLLENVKGSKSSPEAISTAMAFGKRIGKLAILVGNCDGFLVNRVFASYSHEAVALVLEGCTIQQVDQAAREFGMNIGPFQMNDLVGLDVFWRKAKASGQDNPKKILSHALCELDRFGQKNGKGYYQYVLPKNAKKGARPVAKADPIVEEVIVQVSANNSIPRREAKSFSNQEIVERLFYPLINECFKCLEERIAFKASDIDIGCLYGYNMPKVKGGPMHMAKTVGYKNILNKLVENRKNASTKRSPYWEPSNLLKVCAETNKEPDVALKKLNSKL